MITNHPLASLPLHDYLVPDCHVYIEAALRVSLSPGWFGVKSLQYYNPCLQTGLSWSWMLCSVPVQLCFLGGCTV